MVVDLELNYLIRFKINQKVSQMLFIVGKNFIKNDKVCLVLGDNIFYGQGFVEKINEAKKIYNFEKNWRLDGNKIILSDLIKLSETGTETFGLRKQEKLNKEQAIYLASCKSVHEDISLYF